MFFFGVLGGALGTECVHNKRFIMTYCNRSVEAFYLCRGFVGYQFLGKELLKILSCSAASMFAMPSGSSGGYSRLAPQGRTAHV